MTTTAADSTPEQPPSLDDAAEVARRLHQAAQRLGNRARRIRRRVAEIDESLLPLQVAMQRRACELELTSTALTARAAGFRDGTRAEVIS